jgi:integrase
VTPQEGSGDPAAPHAALAVVPHENSSIRAPWAAEDLAESIPGRVLLKRQSAKSRQQAISDFRQIAAAWGFPDPQNIPWARIRAIHIEALRGELLKTRAPATVARILSLARVCCELVYLDGAITEREWLAIQKVEAPRGSRETKRRHVPDREVVKMFQVLAADDSPKARRDAAILAMAFGCGLRRDEIARLELGDFDRDEGEVRVIGKGNKERILPVPPEVWDYLDAYLAARGDQAGRLFFAANNRGGLTRRPISADAVYHLARELAERAGVRDWSPHDARATFIGRVIGMADLSMAQKLAGHASAATTALYDRRGREKRREVMQGFKLVA